MTATTPLIECANPLAGWRVWEPFEWVAVPGGLVAVHSLAADAVTLTVRVRQRNHRVKAVVRGEAAALPGTPAVFQADGSYPAGLAPFCVGRVLFEAAHCDLPDTPAGQCRLCPAPALPGTLTCGGKACPADQAEALREWEEWLGTLRSYL